MASFSSGVKSGLGLGGAFVAGKGRRKEEDLMSKIDLNSNLTIQDPFKELLKINPTKAKSLMVALDTDEPGINAAFEDAAMAKHLMNIDPSGERLGEFLTDRIATGDKLGRKMHHSKGLLNTLSSNGAESALREIDSFLSIPKLMKGAKGKRPAMSESEKNFTRITALRQQLSAAEKSGDESAINAANQQLKDFQQLSGKFGLGAQEKSDIKVNEAANKELSKQAAIASKDAFDSMKKVRTSIGSMTDAIKALDKGAATGPIISKLPNFRAATIELDNARGRMGLDIVGATTFGALSESELKFALDTALPDKLEPADLKDWLTRKRGAQKKLAEELLNAATFLGKPGNTISKYIEQETAAGRLSFKESEYTAVENVDVKTLSDDDLFK
ncbi:hypothetical protein [Pseudoalteromonas sp.]|uniref:hypothetical protein n=1 Tax=Pseudoalteromonas sp. TaxID=53249 RepID=UPI003564023A